MIEVLPTDEITFNCVELAEIEDCEAKLDTDHDGELSTLEERLLEAEVNEC